MNAELSKVTYYYLIDKRSYRVLKYGSIPGSAKFLAERPELLRRLLEIDSIDMADLSGASLFLANRSRLLKEFAVSALHGDVGDRVLFKSWLEQKGWLIV